jgi:hypothetical protein
MPLRLLACLTAGLIAVALTGCGSSSSSSTSGLASESPQTILNSTVAAANSLKSVHAAGSIDSGGQHINLDLHLLDGVGGRGQITLNGLAFELVGLGKYAYLKAPAAVWEKAGAPATAAQALDGKWLRTPASGQFASIAQLTDIHQLFAQLLKPHGKLKTGATSTVAGQKVVAVKSDQGTLYVATTGKPYPVQLAKTGSDGGHLTFDHFNDTISVTAPTSTLDLPQSGG